MLAVLDRSKTRRDTQRQRSLFKRSETIELKYAVLLRKVAGHVGDLIDGFPPGDPRHLPALNDALTAYSHALAPWARATARRILEEVARRDENAWNRHAREMASAIRAEIGGADVGPIYHRLQEEQVALIRSIPIEAAQRVHELTMKSLSDSSRAASFIEEIMRSGEVTKSRATLIARTEVGRAGTNFTQARATHYGSEAYVWETARDRRVRETHQHMQGKIIRWDTPPEVEPGYHYHAGAFPNCRCWPRPLFSDL